tara:strand:+ start:252 stop:446 length:195 start_codon:yes stop_codon:yes gene_type:complete
VGARLLLVPVVVAVEEDTASVLVAILMRAVVELVSLVKALTVRAVEFVAQTLPGKVVVEVLMVL